MKTSNVVLVGVIAALPFLVPIALHPASASNTIFHSSSGIAVVVAGALVALIYYAKRRNENDNLGTDYKKIASINLMMKIVPGMFIVMFLFIAIPTINFSLRASAIQHHGQRVMAKVLDIYIGGCGRNGCSDYVKYQFMATPPGAIAQTITDYAYLAKERDTYDPRRVFAQDHREVPVAYDIANPGSSALNFDDNVFNSDPFERLRRSLTIVFVMFSFLGGVTYLLMFSARNKIVAATAESSVIEHRLRRSL